MTLLERDVLIKIYIALFDTTVHCGEGRVGSGDTLTLLDIGKRDRKAINGQKRGLGKEIYDSQGIVITTSFDQNLWSGR